jgi:hypothetical protein
LESLVEEEWVVEE